MPGIVNILRIQCGHEGKLSVHGMSRPMGERPMVAQEIVRTPQKCSEGRGWGKASGEVESEVRADGC